MKTFKHTIIFLLFLNLGIGTIAHAQKKELIADLKKSNTAFASSSTITMDVKYDVYKNYTSKTAQETYLGFFKRKGISFYSKMLGIETINNSQLSLAINKEEKILIVGKAQKSVSGQLNLPMDTLINHCKEVKLTLSSATSKTYEIVMDNLDVELEKIGITFDTRTTLVTKMVLFYKEPQTFDEDANEEYNKNVPKEKPRVEITYQNIKLNQPIADSEFSEQKIVSLVKNKYKGLGIYNGYKIIDQSIH